MGTDSLVVSIKTEDIYVEIAKNVEVILDISNYGLERALPRGKIKMLLD